MLKKKNRLSRREFDHLLKSGRRVHGVHLSIMVAPSTTPLKCGVVVSKKTAKRATARNLLRRRVYAILGDYVGNHSGYLAVFTKPSCTTFSYQELTDELTTLLARI
jgi:ribonuclease P protein component